MKIKPLLIGIGAFVLLGVAWEIAADTGVYDATILPPPSVSFSALIKLAQSGTLLGDFVASMKRYVPGFLIGGSLGIIVGVASGIFHTTRTVTSPLFHYFRSIPPVALVPFSIVLFGIGDMGKIGLVAWACFFPVWLSTQLGIRHVPSEYLKAAAVFEAPTLRRVFDIWIPSSLPYIVSGLRIAVSTGLFALAASEMFAASSGIAFRIVYSYQLFQTSVMVAMILFLGFIAFLADLLLSWLSHFFARWETEA